MDEDASPQLAADQRLREVESPWTELSVDSAPVLRRLTRGQEGLLDGSTPVPQHGPVSPSHFLLETVTRERPQSFSSVRPTCPCSGSEGVAEPLGGSGNRPAQRNSLVDGGNSQQLEVEGFRPSQPWSATNNGTEDVRILSVTARQQDHGQGESWVGHSDSSCPANRRGGDDMGPHGPWCFSPDPQWWSFEALQENQLEAAEERGRQEGTVARDAEDSQVPALTQGPRPVVGLAEGVVLDGFGPTRPGPPELPGREANWPTEGAESPGRRPSLQRSNQQFGPPSGDPASEGEREDEDAGLQQPTGEPGDEAEEEQRDERCYRIEWRRCGCPACCNDPNIPRLRGCGNARRLWNEDDEAMQKVWNAFYWKGRDYLGPQTGRAVQLQAYWDEDQSKKPRSLHEAHQLMKTFRKAVPNAAVRRRNARIAEWRGKQAGKEGRIHKENYKRVKAQRPIPVSRLPKEDGSFTANEAEKHELTMQEWMKKVFWQHKPEDLPTWEAYEAVCGSLFSGVPIDLPRISGARLMKRARKKANGAKSSDNWAAEEIAALPELIFDEYARLFEAIEAGGEWPEGMTNAPVALLPKVGQSAMAGGALKQRPITVFSVLYRLYGSIRYKDLEAWH